MTYDAMSKIKDINDILYKPPVKHTIILLKQMIRCSKTLYKNNLGILYDRFILGKADDTVVIQSFLGRATGYKIPNE